MLIIGMVFIAGLVAYTGNQHALRETGQHIQSDSVPVRTPVNSSVGAQRVDRSHEGLTKIDASFFELNTATTELNLSYNHLSGALPAEIRHWEHLRVLNISHNQMTGLPAELGQLKDLQELDVSYNILTGLPYELGNLKQLRVLNLSGNAYSKQDLEKIKQGIPQAQIITQ